mgnify:CR=1 FL=1
MIRFSNEHATDFEDIDDEFASNLLSDFNGKVAMECLYDIECIFNDVVHKIDEIPSVTFVALWETITACRKYPYCILWVE